MKVKFTLHPSKGCKAVGSGVLVSISIQVVTSLTTLLSLFLSAFTQKRTKVALLVPS